jgi:hypothetical protein
MLTFEDCIAMSELTEEEIDAIAEHDHLQRMVAIELGCQLVHTAEGCRRITAILRDGIAAARARGDCARAARLKLVLGHFIGAHRKSLAAARAEERRPARPTTPG